MMVPGVMGRDVPWVWRRQRHFGSARAWVCSRVWSGALGTKTVGGPVLWKKTVRMGSSHLHVLIPFEVTKMAPSNTVLLHAPKPSSHKTTTDSLRLSYSSVRARHFVTTANLDALENHFGAVGRDAELTGQGSTLNRHPGGRNCHTRTSASMHP